MKLLNSYMYTLIANFCMVSLLYFSEHAAESGLNFLLYIVLYVLCTCTVGLAFEYGHDKYLNRKREKKRMEDAACRGEF